MTEEPTRPEPDFRVYVVDMYDVSATFTDVTNAVMDVYDIAVHSMDFGSGFLSTEEVGNLRALGKAIGAQRFDYQHDKCLRCGHDYERHRNVAGNDKEPCHVGIVRVRGYGVPETILTNPDACSCAGYIRPEL